jgi:drug/metabolite transporter (DMT)-like permease
MIRNYRLRLTALWARLPANLRGAAWIILAAFLLTIMGALVKVVARDIPAVQIVFMRSLIGTAVVLPFVLRAGLAGWKTKRPAMHALRVAFGISGMFCVFYSFGHIPLADAVAIIFSRPLFAVALAIPFLGEVVGWRRASAAVVGFIGVLIMVRPGTKGFEPAYLVAVAAALFAGSTAIIIKKLSRTESTTTIVLWFSVGGTVISFIPAALLWTPPTPIQWALLLAIGITGVTGQTALTRAFSTGETSFVAPFDYARLLFAAWLGFAFFAEIPDKFSVLGALVIVGSGYAVARLEFRAARARSAERVAPP